MMLMKVANRLERVLFYNIPDERQKALCMYGLELWLYTVLSTVGLIMIGALFNSVPETILMVFIFYVCQSNGGGYHATTHTRCFLIMGICLSIGLIMLCCKMIHAVMPVVGAVSSIILLSFPICLHPHKHYLRTIQRRLRVRSQIYTTGIIIGIIILKLLCLETMFVAACISLFFSALSRILVLNESI